MPRKAPPSDRQRDPAEGSGPPPLVYEVELRGQDQTPLLTSARDHRALAAAALRQGARRGLLAFSLAGSSVRAHLATTREEAGAFARYVASQLGWRLGSPAGFRRAVITPVPEGLSVVAALDALYGADPEPDVPLEASSVPDLLGLRVADPGFANRVVPWLSEAARARVVAAGRGATDHPATLDLAVLADAAAAALALADLSGQSADVIRARTAAAHVAGRKVSAREVGACLGVSDRTIQKARATARDEHLIAAIRRQVELRAQLRAASAD